MVDKKILINYFLWDIINVFRNNLINNKNTIKKNIKTSNLTNFYTAFTVMNTHKNTLITSYIK